MAARHRRTLMIFCLTRVIPQTLLLALIGSAIGFAINTQRIDPLTTDLPKEIMLPESGANTVLINEAYQLYLAGDVVFVDARAEDAFVESHIEGAYSLPFESFFDLYLSLQDWTGGQPILVYGTTSDFPTTDDLARRLLEEGEKTVYLFSTGIEAWQSRDYPIASGEDGLLGEDLWGDDWETGGESDQDLDQIDEEESE